MAEINNNIPNFGYNKKVERINNQELPTGQEEVVQQPEQTEVNYVPDTGVLGRSLVKPSNGANIAKTIDETVHIATSKPEILTGSEGVFDSIYKDLIEQGKNPDDAYYEALMAEEAFLEICPHN